MGLVGASIAAALAWSTVTLAHPLDYSNAQVGLVSSPTSTSNCFYFSLVGINPDPGTPWLSVPRTHAGYSEIVALITSAKLAGAPVLVRTAASTVCGYRQVEYVYLQ